MKAQTDAMKRCSLCLLPETYPGIAFSESGACSYCNYYSDERARLTDFESLGRLFESRIERHRSSGGKYDCLVGFSGGKDSSYVLYYMVRKLGLRVLAFTGDNGFLTDFARKNIGGVLESLDVDHMMFKPKWSIAKEFYRRTILKLGYPCNGCSYVISYRMFLTAAELGIPMVVMGRSRSQMLQSLTPQSHDPTMLLMSQNLAPYDEQKLLDTCRAFHMRLVKLVSFLFEDDQELCSLVMEELFPFPDKAIVKNGLVPEVLGMFLFMDYDELGFKKVLEREIGWRRSADDGLLTHHDCSIHAAADYLYLKKHGWHRLANELSVLIREGKLTRERALQRIPASQAVPVEELELLLRRLDLSESEIEFL